MRKKTKRALTDYEGGQQGQTKKGGFAYRIQRPEENDRGYRERERNLLEDRLEAAKCRCSYILVAWKMDVSTRLTTLGARPTNEVIH